MTTITIGMPVHNDIKFIEHAIIGILQQTHIDFKLIISDDFSSDGSADICIKYAKLDSRIEYIRQAKNIGISQNMMFLLNKATTTYFMWAADDDILDKEFAATLLQALENDKSAILAFCSYSSIDDNGKTIQSNINCDLSGKTPKNRLLRLLHDPKYDDTMGYGLFRREMMANVKFPTWWWPNKQNPYNNIYPSLCYYLAKGQYILLKDKDLLKYRIKSKENINHKMPFKSQAIPDFFAFNILKINLCVISLQQIVKSGGFFLGLELLPIVFQKWYINPVLLRLRNYKKSAR